VGDARVRAATLLKQRAYVRILRAIRAAAKQSGEFALQCHELSDLHSHLCEVRACYFADTCAWRVAVFRQTKQFAHLIQGHSEALRAANEAERGNCAFVVSAGAIRQPRRGAQQTARLVVANRGWRETNSAGQPANRHRVLPPLDLEADFNL